MGFLDQNMSNLSLEDLQQIIRNEVSALVPPVSPAVLSLGPLDVPVVSPDPSTIKDGNVLVFDGAKTKFIGDVIRAGSLEANLVLGTTIIAGDPAGAHVELGVSTTGDGTEGFSAFGPDGITKSFNIDAPTGNTYMKGRLDFGTNSRLLSSDIVEVEKQPSTGFVTPALVQQSTAAHTGTGMTTGNVSWGSPTTTGNALFLVIATRAVTTNIPVAPNTPSGWTDLTITPSSVDMRLKVFYKLNAPSTSGAQTITWTGTTHVDVCSLQLLEYSGVASLDIGGFGGSGTSTTCAAAATGTLGQAGELLLFLGAYDNGNPIVGSPAAGFSVVTDSQASEVAGSPPSLKYIRVLTANLITTSTASVTPSFTLGGNYNNGAIGATFKASAAGPAATPDAGKANFYSADASGVAVLHSTQDDGGVGSLVMAKTGTRWRMEVVTVNIDLPSTAASSQMTSQNITIAGLAVGDLCFLIMPDTGARAFILNTNLVCASAGVTVLRGFNADVVVHDPTSQPYTFLVIHTS